MSANEELSLLGLSYTFALSRRFLLMLDAWPEPYISVNQPGIRYVIVTCILCTYVIIPQLTNIIRAWGNIILMVECIASVNLSIISLIKLSVTRYHSGTLRKILETVSIDWMTLKNNLDRDTMLKVTRRGRSLSFSCYASALGTAVFYLFFHSKKFSTHLPRRLVYQFGYPYDTQRSPNYEITFFFQLLSGICAALINSTVDSFVPMLLLHICSQLMNLHTSLNNLVDDLAKRSISSWTFKQHLTAIIIRHENLMRYVRTIDQCYSATLFMHMLTATFQLCFEIFQLYTEITDKNTNTSVLKMVFLFFYASLVVTHLYIYCYSAEVLLDVSTKLAYGVYECKWYDLPPKEAKDLMFIVYRSTIPLRLTAGKFGIFSMEMFGATLKTSMGYLSVLLTLGD